MLPISTAGKIATMVLCRNHGCIGKLIEYLPGWFRVEADDLCVLVRHGANGWHVSCDGKEFVHGELYIAARMALEKACAIIAPGFADLVPETADC